MNNVITAGFMVYTDKGNLILNCAMTARFMICSDKGNVTIVQYLLVSWF